jgi:serine/threonine-protein kinase
VLEERYHLVRELGRGGFGLVFEAVDELLQRKVAIKVLRPDRTRGPRADKHRERFLGEARHAARINHRNVIAIHDVGEVEDEWYFVMELFEGRSVRELLEERGALPVREALGIVLQAAAGLDAAHALEIVHRDVKPENVLVGADGHVKLVDFGLALFLAEMRTTTDGVVLMTPRYCAPEQVLGDPLGPRTDVFALGCVLFEMLTGRHAFAGESASNVLYTIVNMTPPPRPPDLAPLREDLDAIVRRCLAREPGDRYASCAALARDVEAALARD